VHSGADFPVANPAEQNPYTQDFINDLPVGQSVVSAAATLTVIQGTDPNPSSHLKGPAFLTPGQPTFVSQIVGGLVAGNIYSLNMIAVSSAGFPVELYSLIPCEAVYT
jgi:hypothetical protein